MYGLLSQRRNAASSAGEEPRPVPAGWRRVSAVGLPDAFAEAIATLQKENQQLTRQLAEALERMQALTEQWARAEAGLTVEQLITGKLKARIAVLAAEIAGPLPPSRGAVLARALAVTG